MNGNKRKYRLLPVVLIALSGTMLGLAAGFVAGFLKDLPQIRAVESLKPPSVSRILSADGKLLAKIYSEKREPVTFEQIPKALVNAVLTVEDRKFFRHTGIDLKGIMRAFVKNLLSWRFKEGGSTITQQLAKTLFLTNEKTITRKIKEAILAIQLERRYTKKEILVFYLNQIYLGSGVFGVKAAAKRFFGKELSDLTLAECALIAGLPRAPSRLSPLENPEMALARRNLILKMMLDAGLVSRADYDKAVQEDLKPIPEEDAILFPYYVSHVKKMAGMILGERRLAIGGLKIETACVSRLQDAAEKSIKKGILRLAKLVKKRVAPQAAFLAIDSEGGIVAMVGGTDFKKSSFNRALYAKRQPGSAFKPFVYAAAIRNGMNQADLLVDAPTVYRGAGNRPWRPENYSKKFEGRMTARRALALSKNVPAVRLLERVGVSSVAELVHKAGIEVNPKAGLSLALGTSETTLLDLTAAYSIFPNQGIYKKPHAIKRITDEKGRILYSCKNERRVVITPQTSAVMVDMLRAVVTEGTAKKAAFLGPFIAGKTGTTDSFKDALFIGFTPSVTAGAWVGNDDSAPLGRGMTGAVAALPIWIDFMKEAIAYYPLKYFDMPENMVKLYIDPLTGKSVGVKEKGACLAVFKKGEEPG